MKEPQMKNEIDYNRSLKIINDMLEKGLISEKEFNKIDQLNRKSFSPKLADLMP